MHWRQYQEMQKVVELGDLFLSYVDRGEGPVVVLIHGFPSWGFVWHRVIPELEKTRRVLVPDLAGYGFSDRSDRFDRSLARQAALLERFLEALGVDKASLVGHELGAAAALRFAAAQPSRVERLVLAAPACYDAWPSDFTFELGRPSAARRLSVAAVLKLLRPRLAEAFARPDDALIEGLLAPYSTEEGKLSLLRSASSMDPNHTMELVPRLPALTVPSLVAWGERDRLMPFASARRLAWELPRGRFALIPEAGHFCFVDAQAEFVETVESFLSESADGNRAVRVGLPRDGGRESQAP
jgi:pimeloyl-ACP methyl ester carboxylesterase